MVNRFDAGTAPTRACACACACPETDPGNAVMAAVQVGPGPPATAPAITTTAQPARVTAAAHPLLTKIPPDPWTNVRQRLLNRPIDPITGTPERPASAAGTGSAGRWIRPTRRLGPVRPASHAAGRRAAGPRDRSIGRSSRSR